MELSAIRHAYLQAAVSTTTLLADPALTAAWGRPSALKEFSVHGLAGHLGAQIFHVTRALEADVPDAQPLSVAEFFARAQAFDAEVDAEISVRIRQGGEAAAAAGAKALIREVEAAISRQRTTLSDEPGSRVVAMAGMPMLLDDFLLTRMVEIVVHSDDLAFSADIPAPTFPPQVFEPVVDLLTRLAVVRHGQPAVVRALSRSERAPRTIAAF
ncbi:maleylpyruvate isomerase N-terminal domain-containing protein [Nocardia sp. NPDC059180]|uniref:maleylpyruvate isomerase N-terminal domain-containing protein n=1 Tax=Nocardia sp. NPDC059180 TaxID=3346761 RepID=UPI0036954B25